ncbi:MAG TPA: ornithine carbamoyltransferase [Halanaerobiales bacterium]|nr:ornithine carbamoyltransferase [Halanaerobiales bacterium]
MVVNLKDRNFLTLLDFTAEELRYLVDLAVKLKKKKQAGERGDLLEGRNIALLFEKTSTRTRCAFAVAARDEGGMSEYLGKGDIQLGKKESIADTARVLSRMFDGIAFRGYRHQTVEELAEFSDAPVWNALTDKYHPTQLLADIMTIQENFQKLQGINLVYVGDGRNNVSNSLMVGAAFLGFDFSIVSPKELWPDIELLNKCRNISQQNGGTITVTDEPVAGVKGADVLYTDVWVSMGENNKFQERIEQLKLYQVDMDMIRNTGKENLIFLHCLPAYHNIDTENGKLVYAKYGLKEMEVSDEVFESSYSRVFEQAENRMHTIKALMVATIGKEKLG